MPKIPRSEPMMRVALADQPTMDPGMITGPGRALQQLGNAIGGLGGLFEQSNNPSDADVFNAQMAETKAYNDASTYVNERTNSITGDTDIPTWRNETMSGVDDIYNRYRGEIPQYPKLQQRYDLNRERFRGGFDRETQGTAGRITIQRNVEGAATTLSTTITNLSKDDPNFANVLDTIDAQIDRIPGASEAQRAAVRSKASEAAFNKFIEGAKNNPVEAVDAAKKAIESWGKELQAPAGEPQGQQPGQGVGPQSSAKPILEDVQKTKLAGVRPELVDKFSQLQGELGTTFNINSGFRDAGHNAKVGGAKGSQHIHGNAIDLDVSRMSKEERINVIEKASALGFTGIGVYNNAIHLDLGGRRSWGPSYHGDSVPGWAKGAIATHLSNGFAGGGGPSVSVARSGSAFGGKSPDTIAAVHGVAQRIGADPSAIGAVFTVESGKDWNPKARTGSYRGVSQVGGDTLREMGVSEAAYGRMSQSEQAAFYGKWLDHYKFSQKMQAAGIDFSAQPPARQAAILQAFQFAPNGDWVKRLGSGDTKTPVTNSKQARALGSTSIGDMERYFTRTGVSTQVAQAKPVQVADASGNIPASAISGHLKARVDQGGETISGGGGNNEPTNRPENTIPKAQGQDGQGDQPQQIADGRPEGMSPSEWAAKSRAAQESAQPGEVPSVDPAGGQSPQWRKPSIRTEMVDRMIKAMPELLKARDKYLETVQKAATVSQFITGEKPFNPYSDDDRKMVDEVFKLGDLDKRMFAGDPDAVMKAVEVSQRLNYVPQSVSEALMGLVRSTDEKDAAKRMVGYEGAASILSRNPNAFAATPGGNDLAKEAEGYTALVRAGKSREAALMRIDEMKTPEWAAKAKVRKEVSEQLAKDINVSTVTDYFDPSWLPFNEPDAQFGDMLRGDFVESFKEYYTRYGDEKTAKELAAGEIKKTWGMSALMGGQVMQYPPDQHYPMIGGNQDYLKKDLEETVRHWIDSQGGSEKSKIESDAIRLVPDGKTRQQIARGEPPTYEVMYQDERGVWQLIPRSRWGLGADDIQKVRKGLEDADLAKRKEQGVKIQERDAKRKEMEQFKPDRLLKKGIDGVLDELKKRAPDFNVKDKSGVTLPEINVGP